MERALTVGVGAVTAGLRPDAVLDLGTGHPSAHGALRLALVLRDDVVVRAEPLVGHLHRGAEKLFEARDYRQVLVLADRHDWLSSFGSELGVALAVERLLGLEVPPRAVWLRTLLAELNRVLGATVFLLAVPGAPLATAPLREAVQDLLEQATGGRLHLMANRVGGLHEDVPAGWPDRAREVVAQLRRGLQELQQRLAGAQEFAALAGLGVLDAALCPAYGLTGPLARASGCDRDVRRDDPYLAYAELPVEPVLGSAGDARERWLVLLRSALQALDLADACLERLPDGPVGVRLGKNLRAPEGAQWAWTENGIGAMGWYLVSRGDRTPYRLSMRTPSFNNVSVLPALLPGVPLRDLPAVLASVFFLVGDLDK